MRTPLAWLVLSGLFLAGCSGPEQTRRYLQRELFETPQAQEKYILTGAIERMDSVATARSFRVLQAHAFSEGLAAVRMELGWGYIDTTGRLCIPPLYEQAEDFVSGSAVVCRDTKWGLLGRRGEYILPPRFEAVTGFQDSLGFVRLAGQYYLVDLGLRQVLPLELKLEKARAFSEGLAAVKAGGKWGFVDREGRVLIACQYDEVSSFKEGLCAARIKNKWGYLEPTGNWAISPQYLMAADFTEGISVVHLDTSRYKFKNVFIDKHGLRVSGGNCLEGGAVVDGIAPIALSWKKESGSLVIKYCYWRPREETYVTDLCLDKAYRFSEGLAAVKMGIKWGLIDTTATIISDIKYDTLTSFNCGLSMVKIFDEWKAVNGEGNTVFTGIRH